MTLDSEQLYQLLNELQINLPLLSEDEQSYVNGIAFQLSTGTACTVEQATSIQNIYHRMTQRQFAG
jgi:hypothetical protein